MVYTLTGVAAHDLAPARAYPVVDGQAAAPMQPNPVPDDASAGSGTARRSKRVCFADGTEGSCVLVLHVGFATLNSSASYFLQVFERSASLPHRLLNRGRS